MLLLAPNRVIVVTGSHIMTSHHPLVVSAQCEEFVDSIIGTLLYVEGIMGN